MDNKKIKYFQIIFCLFLFVLPYFIFQGKFFIGGDDTRLFYLFSEEWLKNISISSWFHFSNIGSYNANQFIIPLLLVLIVASKIIKSKLILSYIFFSLPLILGFFYMKKSLIKLLGREYNLESIMGSVFYCLSPILLVGQFTNFLYSVWLVALIPILIYYFLQYQLSNKTIFPIIAAVWSFFFSLAIYSIPWLMGFLFPVVLGAIFSISIYKKNEIISTIKKTIVFCFLILLSQFFWILPFTHQSVSSESGLTKTVTSNEIKDTFKPTILATSKGTIVYPLLDLPHRKIAFDYNWSLKNIFQFFYDKIFLINLIFILVIAIGLLNYRKYLDSNEKKKYITVFTIFLVALFFYTVNIGALRELFILLGKIPGFVMFRNAFDKFALGYIIIFSIFLTYNLKILKIKFQKNKKIYNFVFLIASICVFINFIPVKKIINRPLWTSDNIQTNILFPQEYFDFIDQVKRNISTDNNIFDVPFGLSSYTIVKEANSNNIYAGRSPLELLTGINDYSGILSFPSDISALLKQTIINNDLVKLKNIFSIYNIKYIFETNNIPQDVLNSYLYDSDFLKKIDNQFIQKITNGNVVTSNNGNYQIKRVDFGNNWQNMGLFSYPQNIYSLNSKTDKNNSLYSLINNENILIQDFNKNEHSNELMPVNENEVNIGSGDYGIFSENKTYFLNYNMQDDIVFLTKKRIFYINDVKNELDKKISLFKFDDPKNYALKINNKTIKINNLLNYPITNKDLIIVYKISVSKNITTEEIFNNWNRGDCNAYNKENAVFFKQIDDLQEKNKNLELSGQDDHNACQYKNLDILSNSLYELSFAYKTNSKNLPVYLIVGDKGKMYDIPSRGDNGWVNYYNFFESERSNNLELYLYSGKDSKKSITSYKNISLNKYNKIKEVSVSNYVDDDFVSDNFNVPTPSIFRLDNPKKQFYKYNFIDNWGKGDCAAIDKSPSVFFSEKNNQPELKSINGHNACMYKDFEINSNNAYELSFQYKTVGSSNFSIYVGYDNNNPPFQYSQQTNGENLENFSVKIIPPKNAGKMTLYLYSGSNKNGESITNYNDIAINEIPKDYIDNYLVKIKNVELYKGKVEYEKISNTRYKIHINSLEKGMLLNFADTFDKGWVIYRGNDDTLLKQLFGKKLNFDHYKSNFFSNAWWIDTSICNKDFCNLNLDGKYDIDLVVEFWPQRLFYLGALITGICLSFCFVYITIYLVKYIIMKYARN